MALLEIQSLQVEFGGAGAAVRAVDGVSFTVERGETLGLVGESGSGKSVTALSIMRLLPEPPARYVHGEILVEGHDVLRMSPSELGAVRGRVVSYVFQEPAVSLNPVHRVGAQVREVLRLHRPQAATDAEVVRLLRRVGIPAPEARAQSYPHQLSGGMQQRVMLAMALASGPRLLVADEPTTALDSTIQAQIIDLFRDLQQETGLAILLITHNLAIVAGLARRLAVLYAGQIVECGPATEVLARPRHPYTRALLESVPALAAGAHRLRTIPGSVPRAGAFPAGCRFHPRCPQVQAPCREVMPGLEAAGSGHAVRCPWWDGAPRPVCPPAEAGS